MQTCISKQKELTFDDIINYYSKGENQNKRIGLEYERISIDSKTFKQAKFESLFEIIKEFSKINGFELIYDNETIIGAKNNEGSSISLEPGGQFELSLAPKEKLYNVHFAAQNYISQIDYIAEKYGIKFFAIGNQPKTTFNEMEILNKRRYKIMADYLPKIGRLAPVMMRETAGVQINLDYKNSVDAKRKIKAAILISPFLTGFFANSPFRENKLTKYKSVRALAWKYTGPDRCNLFYKGIIDYTYKNIYELYANYILDVPMIFISRENNYLELNGKITFREFMKEGYKGLYPAMEDYLVHQSLCFPDVRLKNCIEIRNHDSQNLDVAVGIGAIYKGLLYNDNAIDKILDYFAPLTSSDLEDYGFLAAKFGVNFNVEKLNTKAFEIVKKLLYLAQFNLEADEQKYLDWLIDLVNSKRCIADIILDGVKNNL